MGMSRSICIVGCFTGSALLHAIPQYISTRDLMDSFMMFAFFFLQGVVLMLELVVKRIFTHNSKREYSNLKSGSTGLMNRSESIDADINNIVFSTESNHYHHHLHHDDKKVEAVKLLIVSKSVSGQFTTETIVVLCLLGLVYAIFEAPLHNKTGLSTAAVLVSGTVACFKYTTMRSTILDNTSEVKRSLPDELLGWLWLLTTVFILLPLFSIPILHAVKDFYSQSFVIGPVVRTLETILIS